MVVNFHLTGFLIALSIICSSLSLCSCVEQTQDAQNISHVIFISARLFVRKKFKPTTSGTNALFPHWAQHFSHQFFKTQGTVVKAEGTAKGTQRRLSMPHTYNNPNCMDLNNIYGDSPDRLPELRLWIDHICIYDLLFVMMSTEHPIYQQELT